MDEVEKKSDEMFLNRMSLRVRNPIVYGDVHRKLWLPFQFIRRENCLQ